jgi:hypothetical protein
MSDAEWERAYRDAYKSFYTWEHMERILKRLVALRSNKRRTTVHRLIAYREAVLSEGVAKLEAGYLRIRRRRQRRSGLPLEHPLVFYPRYWRHVLRAQIGIFRTYFRLQFILRRIMRDPARFDYRDKAITRSEDEAGLDLMTETRWTAHADNRRAKAASPVA